MDPRASVDHLKRYGLSGQGQDEPECRPAPAGSPGRAEDDQSRAKGDRKADRARWNAFQVTESGIEKCPYGSQDRREPEEYASHSVLVLF
jgi:hypothetical protein